MSRAACRAFLVAALGIALLPSCESETIVLATLPGSDGGAPVATARCSSISDCAAGSYCAMTTCGDAAGTCDFFPARCDDDDDDHPVCGCDHVTYFNDCLRRAAGVRASTPGRCSILNAIVCGGHGGVACPEGARCAQLLGLRDRQCPHDAPGTCWVVPVRCPPPGPTSDPWVPCGPPGAACVDMCTAITSGIPHRLADACP